MDAHKQHVNGEIFKAIGFLKNDFKINKYFKKIRNWYIIYKGSGHLQFYLFLKK